MWAIWPIKIAKFEKNAIFYKRCVLEQKIASKASNIFAALWGVTEVASSSNTHGFGDIAQTYFC